MGAAACATPSPNVRGADANDVITAAHMTARELAHSKQEATVLGCALTIVGERATFVACRAEDACGPRQIEVQAKDVLQVKSVGRIRPTQPDGTLGEESVVVRITLSQNAATSRGGAAYDPARGLVTGGPSKQ